MEYTVPFHSEISGDAVPLHYIVEAMARKAASGFGKRTLHGPTLQNARAQYESLLLSAAREGRLKVCGSHGNMGAVDDLVNAAEGLSNEWSDAVKAILALHVKPSHLNDWAMTNGDVFHLIDVPADVIEYGPTRPDGTKEYRGYAPWPFECFGGHGYFDAGQDGIPIELADDDFEIDGFVTVAGAAAAVAKFLLSKGSPNKFQAERDAWPHILTGVVKGVLHPISPETLTPLSVEHCGNGMVLFSELVAWGQTMKLFAFRKAANVAVVEPVKVGAGGTAAKVSHDGTTLDDSRQAATITTNRLKNRSHPLDAVIELATKNALAPDDWQSVWASLVVMAEAENKPAPLIGYSSDGIQYRGKKYEESGEPDVYKKRGLGERMSRRKT